MEYKKFEWKEVPFFTGKWAGNMVINYREADPWWFDAPGFDKSSVKHVVNMNCTVVNPGGNPWYHSWSWKLKPDTSGVGMMPRRHDKSTKIMAFVGSDWTDPFNLNAEIEFTIGNEKHLIDRPCYVYIPKGVQYGPIVCTKLTRPFLMLDVLPDVGFNGNDLDELNFTPIPEDKIVNCSMFGGRYGKLFIANGGRTENSWYFAPEFDRTQFQDVCSIDQVAIPGGLPPYNSLFQFKITPEPEGTGHPQNVHPDSDETVSFIGTDWENPYDLGGEVEFVIEDELRVMTRSTIVFIPKGIVHSPVWFRKIDRPMIQSHWLNLPYYSGIEL